MDMNNLYDLWSIKKPNTIHGHRWSPAQLQAADKVTAINKPLVLRVVTEHNTAELLVPGAHAFQVSCYHTTSKYYMSMAATIAVKPFLSLFKVLSLCKRFHQNSIVLFQNYIYP